MDAIILAAGYGSRLAATSGCKPLTMLHGKSLLEIGVAQLRAAGAERVIVVTGHQAELIEAALPDIAQRTGIEVVARRVEDPAKPNGLSVIAGSEGLDEPFLLVMADHVFADGLLNKLVAAERPAGTTLLAVDRKVTSPLVDPDDATWVRRGEKNAIHSIGKGLNDYDAVDCGAFLADAGLPAAIRRALAKGKAGSLSDGMQELAHSGHAKAVEIDGHWWIDVDDARALSLAQADIQAQLPGVYADTAERMAG